MADVTLNRQFCRFGKVFRLIGCQTTSVAGSLGRTEASHCASSFTAAYRETCQQFAS